MGCSQTPHKFWSQVSCCFAHWKEEISYCSLENSESEHLQRMTATRKFVFWLAKNCMSAHPSMSSAKHTSHLWPSVLYRKERGHSQELIHASRDTNTCCQDALSPSSITLVAWSHGTVVSCWTAFNSFLRLLKERLCDKHWIAAQKGR